MPPSPSPSAAAGASPTWSISGNFQTWAAASAADFVRLSGAYAGKQYHRDGGLPFEGNWVGADCQAVIVPYHWFTHPPGARLVMIAVNPAGALVPQGIMEMYINEGKPFGDSVGYDLETGLLREPKTGALRFMSGLSPIELSRVADGDTARYAQSLGALALALSPGGVEADTEGLFTAANGAAGTPASATVISNGDADLLEALAGDMPKTKAAFDRIAIARLELGPNDGVSLDAVDGKCSLRIGGVSGEDGRTTALALWGEGGKPIRRSSRAEEACK